MSFPSDLEIARGAHLEPLGDIAAEMGLPEGVLEPYGENVAKIKLDAIAKLADRPRARYVVVTAITPTPLGEGGPRAGVPPHREDGDHRHPPTIHGADVRHQGWSRR